MEVFLARFFHALVKQEMSKKFMELQQRDQNVDAYVAEFTRLSRFVPTLVTDEDERAYLF